MDIAVDYCPVREQPALVPARSAAEIGRVEVFADMAAAEPYWRRLERGASLATPYQRFDLLASWQKHVGHRIGMKPFIVTGFDRLGEPLFLWPFGRTDKGPLKLIRFLGSKHANFNMGLWRRDIVAAITAHQLREIFSRLAGRAQGIDLAVLLSQPLSWDGVANPFSLLRRQPSVDMSASQKLSARGGRDQAGAQLLDARAPARQGAKAAESHRLPDMCRRLPRMRLIGCLTASSP